MEKPSGRFVLRLPSETHQRLRTQAKDLGLSLNQWVIQLLDKSPNYEYGDVIRELQDQFAVDLIGVVLFGSAARGRARSGSDLDMLIVLSDVLPINKILYGRWDEKIAKHVNASYSPHFCHSPDPESASSIWLEVATEGKVLWESGQKVSEILQEIRRLIAANQFERKTSHGHPYWVRNRK